MVLGTVSMIIVVDVARDDVVQMIRMVNDPDE